MSDQIFCNKCQALMLTLLTRQTLPMELFCNLVVTKTKIKTTYTCLKLFQIVRNYKIYLSVDPKRQSLDNNNA